MAAKLDYDALRAHTLGSGTDEAVTVNTRALIDKVLARYSGEWTTLRELLQNAADATSKNVTIRFETLPSPTIPVPHDLDPSAQLQHVLLHHSLKSTVIENDGEVFKETDWARLKKIAEGNPDETKIGAFGVGFYSVFADSEEPFVSSGRQALAFYWQTDALHTKRLQLPEGQSTKTTFMLPMRHTTSPVPNLLSLCQFLTSSLTFVGLESIELWLDNWRILQLRKKTAPSMEVQIPKEVNKKSREGLMLLDSVFKESSQLDACWLRAMEWKPQRKNLDSTESGSGHVRGAATPAFKTFFSRLVPSSSKAVALEKLAKAEREDQEKISENLLEQSSATMFIHVNKATVLTSPKQNFSAELERATKKPPPKKTTVSLLSASYDENAAISSSSSTKGVSKVFDSFLPVDGKGRVFIGFTTNQTTGLNIHISTPSIIPTVERESIDLNNRFVRLWNVELLRMAGVLARISWGQEMIGMSDKLSRTIKAAGRDRIAKGDVESLLPDAVYLHNQFSWSETTPATEVGTLMEESFWTCNPKVAIATLSTQGVLPSSRVRREPENGLGFVDGIPVLPKALMNLNLAKKLIDYGFVTEITVSDIKTELEAKALSSEQLHRFLIWLAEKARIKEFNQATIRSLLDVVVANDEETEGGRLLVLSQYKEFLNTSRIPPSMPLPPTCLPFKFTQRLEKSDLETLGFDDLQMVPWLTWLLHNAGGCGQLSLEQDITQNSVFASAVLPVISKQWEGLSQASKAAVIELLSSKTVIPTKLGMKKPSEAYLPNVKLFEDLPNVIVLHAVKEKFLATLGVRKTIELSVIFERLFETTSRSKSQIPASSARWSHVDLIRYLASVRDDIPVTDIARLKSTRICPAEDGALQPTQERYLITELFVPDQALRNLRRRTLHWPGVYNPHSAEARFLTYLGLQDAPSHTELVDLMSQSANNRDWTLREYALKYFIDQFHTKRYANVDMSNVTKPFLPVEGSGERLSAPRDIFVNERSTVLGFAILRRDLQVHALKFGVKQDPPIEECISRLVNSPPMTTRSAREVFSYLASRTAEISSAQRAFLGDALIVPIAKGPTSEKSEPNQRFSYHSPHMCFLGVGERYAEIFDFVDFGQEANTFLLACGSKHEPSTLELARRLASEPASIFSILGDARYLELLRSLADSWRTLGADKALVKDLRGSKCLLAYQEIPSKGRRQDDDDDDEDSNIKLWQLASAREIVVIDDTVTHNLFKEALLAAPQEDGLETFYRHLGSAEVGSLLDIQYRLGPVEHDQSEAGKLHRLILERVRLFLNEFPELVKHDYSWVQKNLVVQCVKRISVTMSLRGYGVSKQQTRSALLSTTKPILYISSGGADLYEVSQALVPLLLYRSKLQYVFMLEMMLESSIQKLRGRGYNVDRILRAKKAEARIADETRRRQLIEEQQRLQEEQQRQLKEHESAVAAAAAVSAAAATAARQTEQIELPGRFPDSPDREHSRGGLFHGLRKVFDLDRHGRNHAPSQPPAIENKEHSPPPPPYSQNQPEQPRPRTPNQPEPVTSPQQLQQNLVKAIQSSHAHNSDSISSTPSVNTVKETSTYCDAKPGHDIRSVGEINGVKIFLSSHHANTANAFITANGPALKLFAAVIQDAADIFHLSRAAIHIFHDEMGSTIAFNKDKALFFNFHYFKDLHLPQVQQGSGGSAVTYWSIVMAHELAHNLVKDHSSAHAYYTESLVIEYFPNIAAKIAGAAAGAMGRIEGGKS